MNTDLIILIGGASVIALLSYLCVYFIRRSDAEMEAKGIDIDALPDLHEFLRQKPARRRSRDAD